MNTEQSYWDKFQTPLALSTIAANAITLLTLFFSIRGDGSIGPSLGAAILAIVNTILIITTYMAMRNNQKIYDKYKMADKEIELRENKILKLTSDIEKLHFTNEQSAEIVHNFCHEYRCIMGYIFGCGDEMSKEDYLKIRNSFHKFMLFALSNIKELFDILTGSECAVCIKIIVDEASVKTFLRDPVSYRSRSEIDRKMQSFPIMGNTAFDVITNPQVSDTYYICNDLKNEDQYTNLNKTWKKHYNAAMVVPIRITYKDESSTDSRVIGFLCVDNHKGGFGPDTTFNYLASFGDLFFHLFNLYGNLECPAD